MEHKKFESKQRMLEAHLAAGDPETKGGAQTKGIGIRSYNALRLSSNPQEEQDLLATEHRMLTRPIMSTPVPEHST